MVLHHIPQGSGMVVVAAAMADPDRLRHGDLHVVDVTAVPDRLEQGIGETKGEDVLYGFFAQVVVDAVDLRFAKHPGQGADQASGRGQIMTEGFFHHESVALAVTAQTGARSLPASRFHQCRAGWPGRISGWPLTSHSWSRLSSCAFSRAPVCGSAKSPAR